MPDSIILLQIYPWNKQACSFQKAIDLFRVLVMIMQFASDHLEIHFNHLLDQVREGSAGDPSQLVLGLGGVSQQEIDFSGTEVTGVNLDQDTRFIGGINTNFFDGSGGSLPFNLSVDHGKGSLDEFTDSVGFSRGQYVIIGFVLLKHSPHTFNIITGVSPITLSVEVTQEKSFLLAFANGSNGGGDFTSDESSSTTRRFVVEQNSVGQVHAVSFTVVDQDPKGVLLGDSVRGTGVEGSSFGLGHILDLSVKFRSRSLVESNLLFHARSTDGIKHTKHTQTIGVGGVFRHVETDLDMTHGSQVVDFIGLDAGNKANQVGGIAQITIVQKNLDTGFMAIAVNVVNTTCVEAR
mmetsp:Transcript_14834/g.30585  ORF Transcript_14834/g.30585 Transcript_14834/m.30585 type:complete len:350 (-) Transcript_14834:231-1280(-)